MVVPVVQLQKLRTVGMLLKPSFSTAIVPPVSNSSFENLSTTDSPARQRRAKTSSLESRNTAWKVSGKSCGYLT